MEYVTGFVAFAFAAAFVASAFSRRPAFAARSRLELVLTGLDAAAALVLARALMPWADLSPFLWFVPVVAVAAGVFGAVLRWAELPGLRPARARWRSILSGVLHVVVYTLVVFLFVA
jgi:hypothetical protein